jgi:neutral ceramidase
MKLRIIAVCILIAGSIGATLRQAPQPQPAWKAGAAAVSITPRESIWLAGYGARTKPSEGVLQDIHAKALALADSSGAVTVLVTTDLLGFSRAMADPVAQRVAQRYGVPRERLALSASHTHSAPVTGEVLRPAYVLDDVQKKNIERYTSWLLDRVVEVVGSAIANMSEAELRFGQGLAGFAVNRRRAGNRSLPGPVDHDVPVLSVHGRDGRLRAIAFGYACHNTTLSGQEVSGDYAGYAQDSLEKLYPGATALFVAGCGADANPLPRNTVQLAERYGETLAAAVDLVLKGKMTPLAGPLRAAFGRVDLPFRNPPTRAELLERLKTESDSSRRRHAEHLLAIIERDGKLPGAYAYPIQVWQLGRGLTWLMLGGEVVADYALRFKALYGWDTVWASSYTNEVPFYVPSLRVLKEGGYEGGGAMIPYGQPSAFGAAVEELIAEKLDELVQKTRADK